MKSTFKFAKKLPHEAPSKSLSTIARHDREKDSDAKSDTARPNWRATATTNETTDCMIIHVVTKLFFRETEDRRRRKAMWTNLPRSRCRSTAFAREIGGVSGIEKWGAKRARSLGELEANRNRVVRIYVRHLQR